MAGSTRIDRRTLIKGAAAVGGTVWALPVVETITMQGAGAVSGAKQPLPGSLGAQYALPVGVTAVWQCGPLEPADTCLANTPGSTTSDACGPTEFFSYDPVNKVLVIGVDTGWHLVQGSAQSGSQCFPAVQVFPAGQIHEYWQFSAGGQDFVAELLVEPTG